MRLMLLRHAKSRKGARHIRRDRTLNARGRLDAPKLGAYMAHHALRPDRAMVSDSRRTRETWERLSKAWTVPPPASFESELYNAGPDAILDLLHEDPAAPNALLIAHNPGTSSGKLKSRQRCRAANV
jgi:phosphohistidine phosphatase